MIKTKLHYVTIASTQRKINGLTTEIRNFE
jgi:hypothetical protein